MKLPAVVGRSVRKIVCAMAAVSLAVTALAACTSTTPSTASAPSPAIAAGTFGGAFTGSSVASTEAVLASAGIATVSDESSTTPLVPVSGTAGMKFTKAQVRAIALGAADHTGILGSSLDDATTMPAGDVPLSYLLAAWVVKGTSAGAKAVRTIMGDQNWTQAPSVVFPVAALPLFVSDVAAATPNTSALRAGTTTYELASANTSLHSADAGSCTLVSNFILGVLDTVFNALTLNAPAGGSVGAKIGGFFVSIWNEAVSLAQQAVQGLVTIITAPVVSAIQSVAGAVAVVAEVVSYLNPWSVKVTADPGSIAAGDSGSFIGKVDGGGASVDYPAVVSDCASSLGVTLPSLSAEGADATWTLDGSLHATDSTAVTLDKNGSNTIHFTSSSKPQSSTCDSGTTKADAASGTLTVKRPAVEDLRTVANGLVTASLGAAGGIAGKTLQAILEPLLSAILSKLDGLTQVVGTGTVSITGAKSGGADCSNPPTASASPTQSAECLVGTWTSTDELTNGASRGGAGAIYTYRANGTGGVNYSGAAQLQSVPAGNPTQTSGSTTISFTVTNSSGSSGSITTHIVSSNAKTTTIRDHHVFALPAGVTANGTWTCQGGTATFTVSEGAGSTITVDLARQ